MVIWSRRSKANLKDIYNRVAKDSPMNAEKVINEMLDMVLPLQDLPYRGIIVPEVKAEKLRQIPAYSWRIIYHIRSNHVSAW